MQKWFVNKLYGMYGEYFKQTQSIWKHLKFIIKPPVTILNILASCELCVGQLC